ncbi:MAG: ROK family protein [Clostridia bacterium]|nr:ROK family protein [Clostridia bacterium]
MKCLVLDYGGSSVKYALVNDRAEMEVTGTGPAPLESTEAFLDSVAGLYAQFKDRAEGIAMSLPGFIDPVTGVHFGSGAYADILKGKNVIALVRERCGCNVSLENDGKCGALAEAWKGSLSDVKNGAVLVLGSGIGGGVIIDGKVLHGRNTTAGEFSFLLTGRNNGVFDAGFMSVGIMGVTYKLCKMKNLDLTVQDAAPLMGYFDSIAAADYPKFDEPPKKIKADGRQFFRWVDEGDPEATAIYREFLRSLAVICENIQITLAPDRIVIGGGLSRAERLLGDLRDEIDALCKETMIADEMKAEVVRSRYLNECNILGAMYNYIQQYGA